VVFPVTKLLPIFPIGFGPPGTPPDTTTICGFVDCNVPVLPFAISFATFYLDITDTKSNGNAKLKQSNVATVQIFGDPNGCGKCYGQKDDGLIGLGAWGVASPSAGAQDWFNVRHGLPSASSAVNTLTGVEVASWDFCGNGGTGGWAEVGIYPADLNFSPFGAVPDIGNPVATLGMPNTAVGIAQSDWGYPATFYDIADTVSTSIIYHTAMKWNANESCLFVAADDSTSVGPDPCAISTLTTSFGSSDSYNSNAFAWGLGVNWMMKIDWQ